MESSKKEERPNLEEIKKIAKQTNDPELLADAKKRSKNKTVEK
jgi:hypothetical protein